MPIQKTGNVAGTSSAKAAAQERPQTAEQMRAKYDTGSGWLAAIGLGGKNDGVITAAEILKQGGWAEFFGDYTTLPPDAQSQVDTILRLDVGHALLASYVASVQFGSADLRASMASVRMSMSKLTETLGGRSAPRPPAREPSTADAFITKWDHGRALYSNRDRVISKAELEYGARSSAGFIIDMINLPPEEQLRVYKMLGDKARAEVDRDIAVFETDRRLGKLEDLKPVYVDPMSRGLKPPT